MKIEEIQAESEKYAEKWKQFASNHFQWVSKGYADGVLSDTARKHWEPKWISVSERLPEQNQRIVYKSQYVTGAMIYGQYEFKDKAFTHWMPLPTFND